MNVPSVLMVASEAIPFIKTGGLGDVVGALPLELSKLGVRAGIVIPYYRDIVQSERHALKIISSMKIALGKTTHTVDIYKTFLSESIEVYFVAHDTSFNRPHLYGPPGCNYSDNAMRFALFSKAVIGLLDMLHRPYDILHCHDWQTALVPLFLNGQIPSIFTIHNIAFQGIFPSSVLPDIGISQDYFQPEGIEFYGQVNFMKAGIIWSTAITTVSPQYKYEIQDQGHGFGLEGLLKKYAFKTHGILNGVDYTRWDPKTDTHIAKNYHARDLAGKTACRKELLSLFGLPTDSDKVIIGMTSRLTHQKGIDLVLEALPDLMAMNTFLIILGSGQPEAQKELQKAAASWPGLKVKIGFDETVAHKIVAGSDLFLMPSRYEPCGLSQMYSLKYGTVPVVRATGGLKDTVEPYNEDTCEGVGFVFTEDDSSSLISSVRSALSVMRQGKKWRRLIHNGMARDFSWVKSAERYLELYRASTSRQTSAEGEAP